MEKVNFLLGYFIYMATIIQSGNLLGAQTNCFHCIALLLKIPFI